MNEPQVSAVIPTYNRASLVTKAVGFALGPASPLQALKHRAAHRPNAS